MLRLAVIAVLCAWPSPARTDEPPEDPALPGDAAHSGFTAPQRERFEREKYALCEEEGGAWTFCRGEKKMRENAFVRDYRALTHRADFDRALRMRNAGALKSFGAVAGAGLAEAIASIPVCNELCLSDGPAIGIMVALWASAGIAFVGGTVGFVIASMLPNGTVHSHLLSEEEARSAVALYNAQLAEQIQSPPNPLLPRARSDGETAPAARAPRIVPWAGRNGFGFAGSF